MNVTRGDIFYIQRSGAYQGNEIAKDRPGIVVSADHLNAGESCVEVVYLTSQPKKDMNEHVLISSSGRTSTALCEQVYSVTMQRLGNYYGKASASEMRDIDKALASSLGLEYGKNPTGGGVGIEPPKIETADNAIIKLQAERDTYKTMYESLLDRMAK